MPNTIFKNLKAILQNIKKLNPEAELIAVTKNRSINELNEVLNYGITNIGENRIQEAQIKFTEIKRPFKKHLIGHLQSNKVREAVEIFDMIQSVDSLKIAKLIDEKCKEKNKIMPILIQVNISRDPKKFGILPEELETFLNTIKNFKNISIKGLMTIPELTGNKPNTKKHFKNLKNLFDQIKAKQFDNVEMKYLSMGMSDDYQTALTEGSNMIRIGRKIFE